jgi:hypothetical protein
MPEQRKYDMARLPGFESAKLKAMPEARTRRLGLARPVRASPGGVVIGFKN